MRRPYIDIYLVVLGADHIDQDWGSGIVLEERRRLEVGFRLVEEEIVETLDLSCGIGGSYGGKLVEGGVDGVLAPGPAARIVQT